MICDDFREYGEEGKDRLEVFIILFRFRRVGL